MKFKKIIALAAAFTILSSCSSKPNMPNSGQSKSSIDTSVDKQAFTPYALKSNERMTEYDDWGDEFSGYDHLRFGLALVNDEGRSTIVSREANDGVTIVGFTNGIDSSTLIPLAEGTVERVYICDSTSHFIITSKRKAMLLELSNEFASRSQEYFFDLMGIEEGYIIRTSTLVLYPFVTAEKNDIPYRWRIDEICGYGFPKVNGEYQPVTEEAVKPFLESVKQEARGKYKIQ